MKTNLLMRASGAAIALAGLSLSSTAFAQDTAPGASASPAPANEASPGDARSPEAIIVTGSRLANGFNAPSPVAVVGAERLNERAVTAVADALNEVPSFRPTNGPAGGELGAGAGYNGGRILDLRGLGAVRTLTLVDGKRFVPSTTVATVDTNMIPSILLSRAEVVTGGASAQYGSDADSGVVNLILDHKLTGLKGNFQGSVTKYGDNGTELASLAYGFQAGEKLHVVIGGDFENIGGTGDCQARPFCQTDTLNFGRNPGVTNMPGNNILSEIYPSTVPFNGVTVPPSSAYTGKNFPTLRPIDGITFAADGTPQHFQYGTISNNLYMQGGQGKYENIYFKNLFIVSPTQRYAVTGMADYEFTPAITGSLMVNYGHLRSEYSLATYRNAAFTIQADNPFIPRSSDPTLDIPTILRNAGATSFTLGKGFNELGRAPIVTRDEVIRVVGGLKADLGAGWQADAYFEHGENKFRNDYSNNTVTSRITKALDAVRNSAGNIVCRVNADAITTNDDPNCVAYNPFGSQASAAAKAYVTASGYQTNKTIENDLAVNVRGNLFQLPAGPVAIAAGAEYRTDSVNGDADALSKSLAFFTGNGSAISGQIKVTEGYLEGQLPILKNSAIAEDLSLNGAIRRTHYDRSSAFSTSSTVNATTWKVGGVWEVVPAIRFRVTRSRDIRAPNVAELFGPVTLGSGIVTDPKFGQTVVNINGGSNPNLKPEKADTFTAGVVIKPQGGFFGRFRASVDYYNIKIRDAISTLGQQTIISNCRIKADPVSCSLITFAAAAPNDTIVSVTDVYQNVNLLINRGVDFELDYDQRFNNGDKLGIHLMGTYVKDFITVDATGPVQRAGQTGLRGGTPAGLPDLQLDGLVNWKHGPLSLTAHGKYINKGFYNAAFIGPGGAGYYTDAAGTIYSGTSTSTNYVPARAYLDLLASFDVQVGGNPDRIATFYVGVDNVTNTMPPLNPGSHGTGNDILFSPIGQTWKAGFRFKL